MKTLGEPENIVLDEGRDQSTGEGEGAWEMSPNVLIVPYLNTTVSIHFRQMAPHLVRPSLNDISHLFKTNAAKM